MDTLTRFVFENDFAICVIIDKQWGMKWMILKELDANLYNLLATFFLAIGIATIIWVIEDIYQRKKVISVHLVALIVIIISLVSIILIAASYSKLTLTVGAI